MNKLVTRRCFIKLSIRTSTLIGIPFSMSMPSLTQTLGPDQLSNDFSAKDRLLDLADQISGQLDLLRNELDVDLVFWKKSLTISTELTLIFSGSDYYGGLRNAIYRVFLDRAKTNFDSEIIAFPRLLKKSFKQSTPDGRIVFSSNAELSSVNIDMNGADFSYSNGSLKNVMAVRLPIAITSRYGQTTNRELILYLDVKMISNSIQSMLVAYPKFYDSGDTLNDPSDSLPVDLRADFRRSLIMSIIKMVSKISIDVNPKDIFPGYNVDFKNVIIFDGLRGLSNVTNVKMRNELSFQPTSHPRANSHDAMVVITPAYSNTLLSREVAKKVNLSNIPKEFQHSTSVNAIDAHDAKHASLQIVFYGKYTYDWLIDEATVQAWIDCNYYTSLTEMGSYTSVTAYLMNYRYHVKASGFPPIFGPSPDDAVRDTENSIINTMKDNAFFSFNIPSSHFSLEFASGGLNLLIENY